MVEGFPREYRVPPSAHTDRKHYPNLHGNPSAAQEVPRTQEGAFFFTKKAYCGNQTLCVAGGRKSLQTYPPTISALNKPLKITGSKGI